MFALDARLTESRAAHTALLSDIAELKHQLLTLEQAKKQAFRDLDTAQADLIRRQKAIEKLTDTKARLETELIDTKKAHISQGHSKDQPDLSQSTAWSIFEPKKGG